LVEEKGGRRGEGGRRGWRAERFGDSRTAEEGEPRGRLEGGLREAGGRLERDQRELRRLEGRGHPREARGRLERG
jgi:hypothetical protein